jgi:tRNA threonylcarbamoyladenosine biosynthesis protein TsaE
LYHFDFYRFNHPEEFVDAGLGEYFATIICLVEWPDKAAFPAGGRPLMPRFRASVDGRRCRAAVGRRSSRKICGGRVNV